MWRRGLVKGGGIAWPSVVAWMQETYEGGGVQITCICPELGPEGPDLS